MTFIDPPPDRPKLMSSFTEKLLIAATLMISGTGLWFTYQIQRHEAVEQEQRAFSRTRLETAACKEAHAAFTRAAFKAASTETINRARAQEKQACGE